MKNLTLTLTQDQADSLNEILFKNIKQSQKIIDKYEYFLMLLELKKKYRQLSSYDKKQFSCLADYLKKTLKVQVIDNKTLPLVNKHREKLKKIRPLKDSIYKLIK